jgi:hypothetical protein
MKKGNALNENLNCLDNDLKKLILHDDKNDYLTIRSFNNNNDNELKISYMQNINKYLIQTNEATYLIENFNFKIFPNYKNSYNHNYCYIVIEIKDKDNEILFYLSHTYFKELKPKIIEKINTRIDIKDVLKNKDNMNVYSEIWVPLYKNKIKQLKNIMDEFIKKSILSNNANKYGINKL